MKKLSPLLLILSFYLQAAETNTHKFFDETLLIKLSTELNAMSSTTLEKRYGNQKTPPSYGFDNKNQTVSFTFTQYPTPANKQSMNKIHKYISNMLRKSSEGANWKKDKVYTRLDTKIAVYEYETQGIGKYQYNLTYALPVNGKLTFISFITTDKKYKKKWLNLARESLDSLQLKKT
ncbi:MULTISPECIES: hypothetical protein [Thalassotalea]|uniref:hypothetical protein n=1 Tax=Thalassotalea TaxID=1518149 RepID=UPI00094332E7|nr:MULTISPECIES: hypothetical protein [Thalassotalea]OKY27880.1 hypothetical protein BI291_06640 [Thalassotalea sp. PP2-459]